MVLAMSSSRAASSGTPKVRLMSSVCGAALSRGVDADMRIDAHFLDEDEVHATLG